jgi:hypothetical protein
MPSQGDPKVWFGERGKIDAKERQQEIGRKARGSEGSEL